MMGIFKANVEGRLSGGWWCSSLLSLPEVENAQSETPLELELEGELHQARVIHGVVDHPESRGRIYVLLSSVADAGHEILRVIEEIEELGPELQSHSLAEGQWQVLD